MAWSQGIIVQFPDEATARTAAAAIGVDFPEDGSVPSGNENYAIVAPVAPPWAIEPTFDDAGEVLTPGNRETGYWALLRLNQEWAGYSETMAAIQATGAVRNLANPPIEWA